MLPAGRQLDNSAVTITKRKLTSISGTGQLSCIVHYPHSRDTEITDLNVSQFATIQNALRVQQVQSTLSTVYRLQPLG